MVKNGDGKENWFKSHKVLSVIIGLVLLFSIVGAFSGEPDATDSTNANTESTTTNETPAEANPEINDEPDVPAEYRSALNQADTYANSMNLSKQGLYDQLVSEFGGQFKPEAAQYAIDNVNADWKANALAQAKTYQNDMSLSPAAVRDQLASEHGGQFTAEEANYAIEHLND